jgi:hypothetical protein
LLSSDFLLEKTDSNGKVVAITVYESVYEAKDGKPSVAFRETEHSFHSTESETITLDLLVNMQDRSSEGSQSKEYFTRHRSCQFDPKPNIIA